MNKEISRREFIHLGIDLAKVFGLASILGACDTLAQKKTEEPKIVVGDRSGAENEFTHGPDFNAQTLKIFSNLGSMGHGSLVEKDGKLYVYTVEHVAKQRGSLTLYIPDIGTAPLDYSRFTFASDKITVGWESSAFYPFGDTNTRILREFIQKGIITPQKLVSSTPQIGEKVVIPRADEGLFTNYRITRYIQIWGLYEIESTAQYNVESCTGDSGSPILKFAPIKDHPGLIETLGIYGVLSAGREFRTPPQGGTRLCDSVLYFRPND